MAEIGYLGLDVGGTGAKAGVFNAEGLPLGSGHVRFQPSRSEEGHAEIPIDVVYAAARDAARDAVQQSGAHIAALAIASQGQTFVSLDEQDRPLHPAILWYDSRAAADAERLRRSLAERMPPHRVPPIQPIASAAKILWLRRRSPHTMARARRYLLLPDYLAYRLTGEAVTDPSTASTTGLCASTSAHYAPEALEASAIPVEALARIQQPGTPIAKVRAEACEEWRLEPGALVVTGTNDQYAGALGAGNCRPGILSETTGTCLGMVTLTEALPHPLPRGLLGGQFPIPGYYFALAYAKTAGLVLDWFRDVFSPGRQLADLDAMAAHVPIGSRGATALPHFDGMVSPEPNSATRGVFAGLTLHHTLADLYRALLESVAFSLRENLELMRRAGLCPTVVRSIGGGAKSDLWLQMKADVSGMTVERPVVTEAATLGAAILAAVGHGRHPSVAACSAAFYRPQRVFAPNPENHERYQEPFQRYQETYRRLYPSV
ncbi:MAG: FGGY family carbohydrate kinase [Armatimonadota bacterium]|nr:FGGY family carbohydrate kinase [Armatimonadota bacterium]